MRVGMKHILVITLTTLACSKATQPVRDAGVDKSTSDAATPQSDALVSLAVDFTVEGCPSFDAQALTCTGTVPLAIRFVPMVTTTVTQYYWDFGDATPVNGEAAPSPYLHQRWRLLGQGGCDGRERRRGKHDPPRIHRRASEPHRRSLRLQHRM
jgi:hypothetical protein